MDITAPSAPSCSGNTNSEQLPKKTKKLGNQAIHWCFTFNNYDKDAPSALEKVFKNICIKYVFQEEVGEEGTPHLQGYIHLKKKMRWSEFKLTDKIHWEICKKINESISYCQKPETRSGAIFKWGFPADLKLITPNREWQLDILKIINDFPNERKVYWYYDISGGIGKSSLCKYLCAKHNALYIDEGKKADLINIIFNNDMDKCNLIVIDVPRDNGNKVSYKAIEQIKNGMICNTKYETGMKLFNSPHLLIFSNFYPETDKLSLDRWEIFEIKNNSLEKKNI